VLRGEGDPEGKGLGVSEPLAEEVLLNPLLWWKVRPQSDIHLSYLIFISRSCSRFSDYRANGTGLPHDPCHLAYPWNGFSQNRAIYAATMKLAEREDHHNGSPYEGVDTERVVLA